MDFKCGTFVDIIIMTAFHDFSPRLLPIPLNWRLYILCAHQRFAWLLWFFLLLLVVLRSCRFIIMFPDDAYAFMIFWMLTHTKNGKCLSTNQYSMPPRSICLINKLRQEFNRNGNSSFAIRLKWFRLDLINLCSRAIGLKFSLQCLSIGLEMELSNKTKLPKRSRSRSQGQLTKCEKCDCTRKRRDTHGFYLAVI